MQKKCIVNQSGKIMMMKDGKMMMMSTTMTLKNGTMVMPDGTVKMADGTTKMLKRRGIYRYGRKDGNDEENL